MVTIKSAEEKILNVEKFKVSFYKNGINVRSDLRNIPQYPYSKAAHDSWTVAEWIRERFKSNYPGFDVKVYSKENIEVKGNMKLSTIRLK